MRIMPWISRLKEFIFSGSRFRRSLALIMLLLSMMLVTAGEAFAGTYYISPSGNDSNAGTSTAPWATFEYAMTILQPGDTLCLMDGPYYQQLNITVSGTSASYITIKAENDGGATVSTSYDGSGSASTNSPLYIGNHQYIEVDGINFILDPGYNYGPGGNSGNPNGYNNIGGIQLEAGASDIILRKLTILNSGGYNSAVISLAGVNNFLIEDCAASGIGRVVLNMNSCSDGTIRRCWLNWTGPDSGGGDTPNITQVYDSTTVIMENNIGVNYTSQGVEFFNTWAHNNSISGDSFVGNIGYNTNSEVPGGMFEDAAECGYTVSGTVFSNNVAILTGSGGQAAMEINADPNNGSVFINNTFVSPNDTGGGLLLSSRPDCPNQSGAVANASSNSFSGTWSGLSASSNASYNYILAHNYNNYYNMYGGYGPLYYAALITPPNLNTYETLNNPNYQTSTYGNGAYLMVPQGLQGKGANGSDQGASVLYESVNGTLTTTQLWPWPMEQRIASTFLTSVSYANFLWNNSSGSFVAANNAGGFWGGNVTPDNITAMIYSTTGVVNGMCGASNGGTFPSAPTTNLCSAGTATAVSGNGPWTWSCTGSGGGSTANCSANIQTYSITSSAGANGNISPSGTTTINSGGSQTYTITPNTGYTIASVLVDGNSVGTPSSYTFSNVTASHTISAAFAINTYTVTPTAGANGSISPSTPQTVNYDATTSFTVTPNTGYSISSVTGCGGSLSGNTYTTGAITSSCNISATFAIQTYSITSSAGTGGTISPSGSVQVNSGGSQTFIITPNTGYTIASVLVDGNSVGTPSSYTFSNVAANHTISATFAIQTFTINSSASSGGSISCNPSTVNYGGSSNCTITPIARYYISNVLVGGISIGTPSTYTFSNVTANQTISASFAPTELTQPSGLTGSAIDSTDISLSWNQVAGAASYKIYNYPANTVVTQTTNTYYTVSGLSPSTTYQYTVSAVDSSGNESAQSSPVSVTTPPSAVVVFATNVGGPQYTSSTGVVYQADTDHSWGETDSTTAAITGTPDPTLYQTERYGTFYYDIPLANGNYNVTLKFSENYWTAAGQRIFNVSMQGNQVISNLDIYSQVGQYAAYDVTVPVTVSNGLLNIYFTPVVDQAKVDAILVTATAGYYSISSSAGTGGSISPSGTTPVVSGGSQTYTITPNTGYTIASVMVDGNSVGTPSSYTFSNVTANHTISATFAVNVVNGVCGTSNGGTFTSAPTANLCSAGTASAVSGNGPWAWSCTGSGGGSTANCSANIQIYTINASAGANGSISPSGNTQVNYGGSQTFTVSPNAGYSISSVLVDGSPVTISGSPFSYTFSNVTANHTISASFAVITSANVAFATNVGGPQYTSSTGVVYQADTDHSWGETDSTTAAITGTPDPTLYQTERYGTFYYDIPLANGNYNVTLKFSENYWTAAGQRIFNVSMQGNQVISNLDIYSQVGQYAAYDVTVPVTVSNGLLNIYFTPVVDQAKVDAILVTSQ